MATRQEKQQELADQKAYLTKLKARQSDAVDGGVKSYTFGDGDMSRATTLFTLKELREEIRLTENRIALLEKEIAGRTPGICFVGAAYR